MKNQIFFLLFFLSFNVSAGLDSFSIDRPLVFSTGRVDVGGVCAMGSSGVSNSEEQLVCKQSKWVRQEVEEVSGSVCGMSHLQSGWRVTGGLLARCKGHDSYRSCPSGYSQLRLTDDEAHYSSEGWDDLATNFFYYHCVKN